MKISRLLLEWLVIGVSASILLALVQQAGVLQRPNQILYDMISPLHAPSASDQIVVVAIDNQTLAALGRWPWSRTEHAKVLERLKALEPAAIVYNVLFVEPSSEDEQLAIALSGTPPVYLPLLAEDYGHDGAPHSVLRPAPLLGRAAAGVGSANFDIDPDGATRSIAVAVKDGATWEPHLSELVYRQLRGKPSAAFEAELQNGRPHWPAFLSTGSFRTISFAELLSEDASDAQLRGKILFAGATAAGMGDLYQVSDGTSQLMSGAEVQANLLSNLLNDSFVVPITSFWILAVSLILLWLLLVAFWYLPPTAGLLLSIGTMIATILGSTLAVVFWGIWFPPVAALLGVAMVYPLWGWRRLTAISQFIDREINMLLKATGISETTRPHRAGRDRVAQGAVRLHDVIKLMRRSAAEREETMQFLSHDMRSPQAAIIALLEGAAGSASDKERKLHDRIRRYAETTLGLADDFVHLARLEMHAGEKEPVDVRDAMAQAVDMVWPRANAKGVKIERGSSADFDLWTMGDAAAIVRAFTNLLNNAVEASSADGVIRCEVLRQRNEICATISDQGPGLPPERRDDPFARFGYSGSFSGQRSSGLGLAFVGAVVRRHGGSAHYADGEKGGARFTLRLPLLSWADNEVETD